MLPALCIAQTAFTSSNLPIVIIDTHGATIVNEPKIDADMGIIDNGMGKRNNLTDSMNNFNGKIGIEIRGSSSQMFPKKQYGIEIRDETGEDMDAALLGMPEESDWVLYAPYSDKSLMRNVLAYQLGRDLGHYAPRTKYCEVVLNGEYMGVFVLIEKIKRGKDRVDINKLSEDEISGDDLTGGYIVKIDKFEGGGGDGWFSAYTPPNREGDQTIYFQYEYPKSDNIVAEQKTYIQEFLASFENVLYGDDFADPVNGYAKYIDVDAFVDFFIANEIAKNPDAYRLSTFMYKQKDSDGGKLAIGPIWDFNLAFGNVDYCTQGTTNGFAFNFNTICPADTWLIPFWWYRLFEDPVFKEKVSTRWASLRQNQFKTETVLTHIDSIAVLLNTEAQQRNFQKWPVLGTYVWPNYYVGQTFQEEVDWLKNWVTGRTEWLDAHIGEIITGTDEGEVAETQLILFPNPMEETIHIEFTAKRPGAISVECIDLAGKAVLTAQAGYATVGKQHLVLTMPTVAAGAYLLKVRVGNDMLVTRRLLKK